MAGYGPSGFDRNQVSANYLSGQRSADASQANMQDYQQNILNQQRVAKQDEEQSQQKAAQQLFLASQYALQAPPGQAKAFVEQNFPDLVTHAGAKWATATEDDVRSELTGFAAKYGSQAGVGPAAPQARWTSKPGPRGSTIQENSTTGEQKQVVGPDNSQPSTAATPRFRAMNPQEISSYGLPPGSAAQINDTTGQIQVLNKPSVAPQQSAAERKAMVEAKVKLPRVTAAIRRAERLSEAIKKIAGNSVFDGGPLDAKALSMTQDGREVMAAAAQLTPELQALTRVPGIGSQSDLEARLASLALPSLEFAPETNAKSMAELFAFIQDLKAAYETAAAGGVAVDAPDEASPAAVAPQSGAVNWADLK